MVPKADPSDRLNRTRGTIERDIEELRVRFYSARAKVSAGLTAVADLGKTMSGVVVRRNGARPSGGGEPHSQQ
jgi:hypothetical protein